MERRSIQSEAHIGKRDGNKVGNVDASREKFRLAMRWDELSDEIWSNR